jgi:hypothetical protein
VVTTKNGVFWEVTPCGSCKNRRFGRTYRLHHQDEKNKRGVGTELLVTANVVPSYKRFEVFTAVTMKNAVKGVSFVTRRFSPR